MKKFGAQGARVLQRLIADGVIEIFDIPKARYSQRFEQYVEINNSFDGPINTGKVGQKVIDILKNRGMMKLSEVRTVTGASHPTVKLLIGRGYVRLMLRKCESDFRSGKLNENESMKSQETIELPGKSPLNLNGNIAVFIDKAVAGDGKMGSLVAGLDDAAMSRLAVYLARSAISRNFSVLFIFSNIDKIAEVAKLIRDDIGIKPIEIHANLSSSLRAESHARILHDRGPRIVLGTRAAAFTAFPGLKLMVLFGDGDYGMRETSSPAYNARDVVLKRSKLEGVPCTILSTVPSMESYSMAVGGELSLHISDELDKRMRNLGIRFLSKGNIFDEQSQGRLVSGELLEKVRSLVEGNESVLFFINRRGYAGFVRCSHCHKAVICDNCGYAMSLYKDDGLLICHACRSSKQYTHTCPLCSRGYLSPVGFGTQRMETELRKLFFDKKVLRLDSDLSGTAEREAELLVASGSPALIVGTQKLGTTRFVRLPKLIAIFGFDFMVNYPDFRCREDALRTLASLADRIEPSGSGESILIETSMEELPFYKNLQNFNLKSILDMELGERKIHSFPPYVEQLGIMLESLKPDVLLEAEEQLEGMLNKLSQIFDDISFYKLHTGTQEKSSGHQSRSFILSAHNIFKRSAEISGFLNSFQKTAGRDVKLSVNTDPSAFI